MSTQKKLYLARDKNGRLFLHIGRPVKMDHFWYLENYMDSMLLPKRLCPWVKWEDEEPVEIKLVPKNKK